MQINSILTATQAHRQAEPNELGELLSLPTLTYHARRSCIALRSRRRPLTSQEEEIKTTLVLWGVKKSACPATNRACSFGRF